MTSKRQDPWSDDEFSRRLDYLIAQGFTPEEAYEIAGWHQDFSNWMLKNLIEDRQTLMKNLKSRGLPQNDIDKELTARYLRLGIRGQYEEEDWYFDRKGAAASA